MKKQGDCLPVKPMGRCQICGSTDGAREKMNWYCERCEERLAIKQESGIPIAIAMHQIRREIRDER